MKLVVLLLLAVVATANAKFQFTEEWELWKKDHGKEYSSDEEELLRRIVWEANKNYVDNHNEHAHVFGYTVAMNQFADLESGEFMRLYTGYRHSTGRQPAGEPFVPSLRVEDLPESVNWNEKGWLTEVKNQGQCGGCWAFSATGSLEGQHFNRTGKLVSLSEQNLIDCSTAEGNHGCEGGLPDQAFQYIIKNGGIDTEDSYRYQAHDEKCRFNAANIGANMTSFKDIASKSESDLQVAVATIGPISVGIDASHISFKLYQEGVYHDYFCSQTKLDHGVLAAGYGDQYGKLYWWVKNSWGAHWGMDGFIMMSRNRNNNCGIATQASYPVI